MERPVEARHLVRIPVHRVGAAYPMEALACEEARAQALIDSATGKFPAPVLAALDAISRRWLARHDSAYLPEIDDIAARLNRPGAYFLSVNYEWGCTCKVAAAPNHRSARLIRVLDWGLPGLGRNVIAARVSGAAGPFTTLTWPGYTGLLQGMAPQRFAAALNQAPMRNRLGTFLLDWGVNLFRVWDTPHITAAHLLREVFESAPSFEVAKRMLVERPIAAPAIFSLAGLRPSETAVIERTQTQAQVHEGSNVAANHWQAPGWRGHARGYDSAGRACRMHTISTEFDPDFPWLASPLLRAGSSRAASRPGVPPPRRSILPTEPILRAPSRPTSRPSRSRT